MTEHAHGAPVHPADALAAEGKTITLADGRDVTLRYSMGSLRLLEARFGSLQGMQVELTRANYGKPCPEHAELTGERDPETGDLRRTPGHGAAVPECETCVQPSRLFTVLSDAIAPALLHETVTDPDSGQRVRLGKYPELLAEQLSPGLIGEYMKAWAAAFGEAMAMVSDGRGNAPAGGPTATTPSPGPSGTTPQPSYSGGPTVPFGA